MWFGQGIGGVLDSTKLGHTDKNRYSLNLPFGLGYCGFLEYILEDKLKAPWQNVWQN